MDAFEMSGDISRAIRVILAPGIFAIGCFIAMMVIACFGTPLEWWSWPIIGLFGAGSVYIYWVDTRPQRNGADIDGETKCQT